MKLKNNNTEFKEIMKITLSKQQWQTIGKKTGWIKSAQSVPPGYPYYLVITSKGRFQGGPYPQGIEFIPDMKRQWDAGGLGTGKIHREHKIINPKEIQSTLKQNSLNPYYDQDKFDIYVVRAPQSPRRKLNHREIIDLIRPK